MVEDPKIARELDVKMVDILKINMYLHCKVFWVLVLVGVMLRIRVKALGYSHPFKHNSYYVVDPQKYVLTRQAHFVFVHFGLHGASVVVSRIQLFRMPVFINIFMSSLEGLIGADWFRKRRIRIGHVRKHYGNPGQLRKLCLLGPMQVACWYVVSALS